MSEKKEIDHEEQYEIVANALANNDLSGKMMKPKKSKKGKKKMSENKGNFFTAEAILDRHLKSGLIDSTYYEKAMDALLAEEAYFINDDLLKNKKINAEQHEREREAISLMTVNPLFTDAPPGPPPGPPPSGPQIITKGKDGKKSSIELTGENPTIDGMAGTINDRIEVLVDYTRRQDDLIAQQSNRITYLEGELSNAQKQDRNNYRTTHTTGRRFTQNRNVGRRTTVDNRKYFC